MSAAPEGRLRRALVDRAAVVAVVLVLGQAVWRGAYLLRGYYTQDDFLMLALGARNGLSLDYLFRDYAGHLWPAGFVVAWVTARVDPMSWGMTAVSLLVLQALAGALMWLVLTRLMGAGRWARVPVLAVFLFAPATIWPLQWWAVAIQYLPVTTCLLAAVWAMLRTVQDGWGRGQLVVVASTAAGLAFQERAMLYPIVLYGVALVVLDHTAALRRPVAVLTRFRWMWLALAALLAGYLVLHAQLAPIDAAAPTGAGESGPGTLGRDFVLRTLAPTLVGGPWQGRIQTGMLVPPTWAVWVAGVVAAGVVVVTSWRGGASARLGWLMLAVYVAADIVILFGGRTQFGLPLGLIPRYVADVVPVATIALGCSLRSFTWPLWRPRAGLVAAGAATTAYVVSAAVSTSFIAPTQLNADVRDYVSTVREQIRADPRAVLYDSYVPTWVMIAAFGEDRRLSTVLAAAPENPVFDVPSEAMRIADESGRLRPLHLAFSTTMVPNRANHDCGYPVTAQETVVPLRKQVKGDRNVMTLGYYTAVRGTMVVRTGRHRQVVPVQRGLHALSLVVDGPFRRVGLTLEEAPGTVCVAALEVGFPVPEASGPS